MTTNDNSKPISNLEQDDLSSEASFVDSEEMSKEELSQVVLASPEDPRDVVWLRYKQRQKWARDQTEKARKRDLKLVKKKVMRKVNKSYTASKKVVKSLFTDTECEEPEPKEPSSVDSVEDGDASD